MKKASVVMSVITILALPGIIFAQGQGAQGQGTSTLQGYQVQNQNQVITQNQGEDTQLQVATQEQESLGDGQGEGLQIRNQNAIENMSTVAAQVQQLLQVRTTGGIGEQVRLIAQEQNQAQTQIQNQLNKLESKGKMARFLSGTDYGAVKNLKAQLVQNQVRIDQLTELQNQLVNQGDITMVQETIQALIAENTSLQERITSEEGTKSMFGWLFRFFAR